MKSFLQNFMFDKLPVKGSFVEITDVWDTIVNQQNYPQVLQRLLGELLVANVLLTANLKLDGKLICQIQDNQYFRLMVSECSSQFTMRGTIKYDVDKIQNSSYLDLLSSGSLIISIDAKSDGQLYQSVVEFNGDRVDQILNNYMLQSEQLRTLFIISYSQNKLSGFMLQQLPDINYEFYDDINRLFMLGGTLQSDELLESNSQDILRKLFNEDDIRIFQPHELSFKCTCDKNRVLEILSSLGEQELKAMSLEQKIVVVNCDYCNSQYSFERDDLEQLILKISLEKISPLSHEIN